MNDHEAQRIAAATHELRPDWPASSVLTLIRKNLIDKPRRDVSVAFAWIACESNTANPGRVLEMGPWWRAAGIEGQSTKRAEPENHERCSTCSLHRTRCVAINANDHDFRPWTYTPEPVDTKATIAALKSMLEPTATPPEPEPLLTAADHSREPTTNPAVVAAREQMAQPEESA